MPKKLFVPSDEWRGLFLDCELQTLNGDSFLVPTFTRANVVSMVKWLWRIDPEMVYDPEDARTHEAPQETYLLDDLMKLLVGGVFTVAYPTDYGKSTLIEMSCVISLLIWPKDTVNTIVKANEDAAVAAARVCWWKLNMASDLLPYAKPLSGLRQGNPEVKKGFFIEGSELRTFGGRDQSLYPAGIGDGSLPGRRGRAHFDDLETENIVKSEAKMDSLRKAFNSCVRLIQRKARMLFAIFGTPQGANSLMYSVKSDFQSVHIQYESITRPEYIQAGPKAGQLLWPAARIKAEIQRGLMDPAAYAIAYSLKPPGSGWYDGETAKETLKDYTMPFPRNQQEFQQWLVGRLYEQVQPKIGFHPQFRYQSDADKYVASTAAGVRFYIGWDPASVGTYSLHLLALGTSTRYILRSIIDAGTPDEQAYIIRNIRRDFPSLVVVLEADATQLSFASILMHIDPRCPWTPHMTHGYNKDSKIIGIPSMMREIMEGRFKLPWVNDEHGEENFGALLREVLRWGPVSHPHGIPSIWFSWFMENQAAVPEQENYSTGQNQSYPVNIPSPFGDPLQPRAPREAVSQADEAWNRRWRPFR